MQIQSKIWKEITFCWIDLSGSQPVNREIQLEFSSFSYLQMNKHVTKKVLQFREDSNGDVIIAL